MSAAVAVVDDGAMFDALDALKGGHTAIGRAVAVVAAIRRDGIGHDLPTLYGQEAVLDAALAARGYPEDALNALYCLVVKRIAALGGIGTHTD